MRIGERLVKDVDEAGVALRTSMRRTPSTLHEGTPKYGGTDAEIAQKIKATDPGVTAPEKNTTDGVSAGSIDPESGKPEHVKGKLDEWIYGNRRPGFPAKTKNDVNKAADQRADGTLICATTGKSLEVQRKPNGEPQFFKYNDNNHAKKVAAPEWYDEWKAQNDLNPIEPPIVKNKEEFTKPAPNIADMGHIEGAENWRLQQFALYHRIDEQGYKELYTDSGHYRLEERSANRSHGHESTEPGYGIYAEYVNKYPPLPGAPDPQAIVKGFKKPGSD